MDEAVIKQIQREGADALLDIGVSVPLKAFHMPFRKSPLELRVTMRRPYMSGQILFARTYLSMGITSEERKAYEAMETSFQKYVCRRHTPIRDLYQDSSAGCLRVTDYFPQGMQQV